MDQEWEVYNKRRQRVKRQDETVMFLGDSQDHILNIQEPETVPFEVAWDTGAVDHVASRQDLPGHEVKESVGSRGGKKFITASGKEIAQEGQAEVKLLDHDDKSQVKRTIGSVFQVTEVHRPLWSISKILDNQSDPNSEVVFRKTEAITRDSKGKVFARAVRHGGLYVAELQLKNPKYEGFGRRD